MPSKVDQLRCLLGHAETSFRYRMRLTFVFDFERLLPGTGSRSFDLTLALFVYALPRRLRTRSETTNVLCPASVLLRHVTVRPRRLHLTPFDARVFTTLVPFGSVSVATTVCAVLPLLFETFSFSANVRRGLTDFEPLDLIAVSTRRWLLRLPSTFCSGVAKPQAPVDGPSLITRSWRSA